MEISKQNVQEFRPELLLNPLSQLNLQPQFIPLGQFGQLKAAIYYQPGGIQGFDGPAHLSALPSVLAQRELLSRQQQLQNQDFAQNPIIVQDQPALVQEPLNQYQPIINQYQPIQPQVQAFPSIQPQSVVVQPQVVNQLQPQPTRFPQQPDQFGQQPNQFSLQPGQFQEPAQFPQQPNLFPQQPNQFPQQPAQFPQQPNQFPQQPDQSPLSKDVEQIEQNDQQVVYQNYQPQFYQPANQYQNEQQLFLAQPGLINQNQLYQPLVQYDQSQAQVYQDQNALQSGLEIDQGNDLEGNEQEDLETDDEGSKATAVATAFGAR